jgi:acetylornithine/N-succinyldiaminopimelate aminotransferase
MAPKPGNSSLYDTFARAPIAFARGEGVWLEATDGRRLLDFSSGIAVNALGHAHPALVKALTEQAGKLWHVSNLYQIPEQETLAAKLVAETFADKVFFGNSGAEAVECAIKTVRRYHFVSGHPEKNRIITFAGAFHGRTLAALSATGSPKYSEGMAPMPDGFDQVPFDDIKAVAAAITPETAAIMIEPIQGEGGVRLVPAPFLHELRALCEKHGLLLVYDEVQSGVGRTGKLFAYQWSGVEPDVMTVAKGIGGGFPLGACLATAEAAKGMTPGMHNSTFGGNPLAMAVGNAVLDVVLEDGFLDEVGRKGLLMKQGLAAIADEFPEIIDNIRGIGLMLGLKCVAPNTKVSAALRGEKVLSVPAGDNVVRLLPPLIISEDEIRIGLDRIRNGVKSMARTPASAAV